VAAVWAARASLDALALFLISHVVLPGRAGPWISGARPLMVAAVFLAGAWLAAQLIADPVARLSVLTILVAALVLWEWRVLLGADDRLKVRQLCNRLLTSAAR
jgi:UDP-N-acetylmuramyl pentapeptide phosphotransferase/UDP-N-acetylglucosamine-1-phosphate transferase